MLGLDPARASSYIDLSSEALEMACRNCCETLSGTFIFLELLGYIQKTAEHS